MKKFVLFIIFCICLREYCDGQDKFEVFFLAIGSGHYEHDSKNFNEKDFIPYDDLPEATYSAKIVGDVLRARAAANGRVLLSSDTKRMTKKRIMFAIDSMDLLMRQAKQPLFVFYYCGHGISENMGWNQFFIPGNYTSIAGTKKIGDLKEELVFLGDVIDRLDQLTYRYLVLVDCCRKEEADNSLPEARLRYFFDQQNVETFKTVVAALKKFNEYHQINPVVFSIAPGNSTPVVDTPNVGLSQSTQIGPICRRLLLMLEQQNQKSFSLEQVIINLTSIELDKDSPTSVSFYSAKEDNQRTLFVFR